MKPSFFSLTSCSRLVSMPPVSTATAMGRTLNAMTMTASIGLYHSIMPMQPRNRTALSRILKLLSR